MMHALPQPRGDPLVSLDGRSPGVASGRAAKPLAPEAPPGSGVAPARARRRWPAAARRRLAWPVHRVIVAFDMESSTMLTNPEKHELRSKTYEFLGEALTAVGVADRHLDRLTDRGDGVLALVRPADEVPKTLLLTPLMPKLSGLLDEYNRAVGRRPGRRLRLRAVVHAGEVHDDGRGFFGEALDVAFRLLDAAAVKRRLRVCAAPLVLVVSEEIYWSIVRQGYDGINESAFEQLVRVRVGGRSRRGWVHIPAPLTQGALACR